MTWKGVLQRLRNIAQIVFFGEFTQSEDPKFIHIFKILHSLARARDGHIA